MLQSELVVTVIVVRIYCKNDVTDCYVVVSLRLCNARFLYDCQPNFCNPLWFCNNCMH